MGRIIKRWSFWKRDHKTLREDILKHLLSAEVSQSRVGLRDLEDALGQNADRIRRVLEDLLADGQVSWIEDTYLLSPSGREIALNILRAHRLWERFLADETGYAGEEWHTRAEFVEHHISPEEVESLSLHLGNPAFDPHGDPIPTATGEVPPLRGMPLNDLVPGTAGRVVHLEDEPEEIYRQLLENGLAVGLHVFLIESAADRYLLWVEGQVIALRPVEGKNVYVIPDPDWNISEQHPGERLSDLDPGESGIVIDLLPVIRGQERRRLMDLGVIPGTRIRAEFNSPSGDPTAYQVRGTFIALRKQQADQIQIRRTEEDPG